MLPAAVAAACVIVGGLAYAVGARTAAAARTCIRRVLARVWPRMLAPASSFVDFPLYGETLDGCTPALAPGLNCSGGTRVHLQHVQLDGTVCGFATALLAGSVFAPPLSSCRQTISLAAACRARAYLIGRRQSRCRGGGAVQLLPGWYNSRGTHVEPARQALLTLLLCGVDPHAECRECGVTDYGRSQVGVFATADIPARTDVLMYSRGAYVALEDDDYVDVPGFAYAMETQAGVKGARVVVMGNPLAAKGCFVNRGNGGSINLVSCQLFFVRPDGCVEVHVSMVSKRVVRQGAEILTAYGERYNMSAVDAELAAHYHRARQEAAAVMLDRCAGPSALHC